MGRACRASRRARIGEDLDPVAAAVDPLPGEVHAPQGADLGRFVEPLPVSAGDVLGIVDLVAGPERAEWVVAQVGDGADTFAARERVIDLHDTHDRAVGQLRGAAVVDRRRRACVALLGN